MKLRPDWQQLNRSLSRTMRGSLGRSRRHPLRPVTAQALVEFMLVSIPLLATMFAIFEFGMAFWDLAQVGQVARDAARETAACANQCDGPGDTSVTTDNKYYKDVRALQAVINRNPVQSNGTKLNVANIDYVLIRRIADTNPANGLDTFVINSADGLQVDISRQYQLYVNVLDPNGAMAGGRFIPFQDATAAQAQAVGLPDPSLASDNKTSVPFNNTNYLSSPCLGIPSGNTLQDTSKATNAASGMNFTCRYQDENSSNYNDPNYNWSRGRPVCQPTERFYVEIAYRHYWVTPFLPDMAGGTVARPKDPNGNSFVLLKQRSYLKVEPRFFPVNGGVCPTGVS